MAFASETDNFVMEPENGLSDVFLYDTQAKTFQRVAQAAVAGFTRTHEYPEISENGNRISYMSRFINVTNGDARGEAFVYDIATDTHIQVNLNQQGLPAQGDCIGTSDLNPTGQFVVVSCNSQDLVIGDTNDRFDVYVSNLATGLVRRVSVRSDGSEAIGGHSRGGTISADGSKVSFYSDATNLVDGDFNGQRDVFLHDLVSGSTIRMSEPESGDSNDRSGAPRISPDGSLVLFMSEATNLTADAKLVDIQDVFIHDVASGTNTLLTRGFDGSPADDWSTLAEFSTDGKFIFYSSAASNIVPGDVNGKMDIFLYEIATGETKRLSELNDGSGGNDDSRWAAISDGAKVIAIESLATNFGWYDTNNSMDIYLKSLLPAEIVQRRFHALPDVNGNGIPDVAALISGSADRIEIRDGSTDVLISSIDFGVDTVIQVEVLPDLNSSGRAEIAALQQQSSGQVRVQIRDSLSGNVVRNLYYGATYSATAMRVIDDYNGNGAPEIAVMGSDATDAIRVQVQDAGTGAILDNVFLGNQGFGKDFVAVSDTSGNGMPELGILSVLKGNEQVRMQLWDAMDATFQTNVWFGSVYQPQSLITMPDINANGAEEIVAIGVDPATQNVRVQVRDSASTATHYNIWLGNTNEAVDVALVNDINGNGYPDLAVLLKTPQGTGRVRVQDGLNGAFIRNLFFSAVENPTGLTVMPDYSGNGFEELAALGENDGVRHVQILDTSSGSQVNRIDYPQ